MASAPIKILVVDDEDDILEFIEYNLRKEGYEVTTASDGKEALSKAASFRPDLILLDIMMPEMDGIEVCSELRSDVRFEETIIAFLTARSEDFTQIAGFDVGGDDYINKPIKPRLLVSRIKALVRRKRNANNNDSVIRIGNLEIDRERYQTRVAGEVVKLARKEFELLALLASKPGKVFSRQEIFRKVWGYDVIVGDRTIDVHIRKLREKIGSDRIETVKGIGYKMDA